MEEILTEKASNEGRRCYILHGHDLYVGIFVLDLRQKPKHETSGAMVMLAVQMVIYGKYFDLIFQHQFAVVQVVECTPDRRFSLHERHSVAFGVFFSLLSSLP